MTSAQILSKVKMKITTIIIIGILLITSLNLVSAVTIERVSHNKIMPGEETELLIQVKNNLDNDVKEVSLNLDFTQIQISSVGSSEDSVDEIEKDDSETFTYTIRADNDASPGNYDIPYTLKYDEVVRQGTIGIKVSGNPDLSYIVSSKNNVINMQGTIELKIINTGFSKARFLKINIISSGFGLLSEEEIYIGDVDSDDFETASFNVVFNNLNPKLIAQVNYRDFDNKIKTENIELPVKVYTQEKALQLGIIQKSNSSLYFLVVILIILLYVLWRILKKRKRMKKAQNNGR